LGALLRAEELSREVVVPRRGLGRCRRRRPSESCWRRRGRASARRRRPGDGRSRDAVAPGLARERRGWAPRLLLRLLREELLEERVVHRLEDSRRRPLPLGEREPPCRDLKNEEKSGERDEPWQQDARRPRCEVLVRPDCAGPVAERERAAARELRDPL